MKTQLRNIRRPWDSDSIDFAFENDIRRGIGIGLSTDGSSNKKDLTGGNTNKQSSSSRAYIPSSLSSFQTPKLSLTPLYTPSLTQLPPQLPTPCPKLTIDVKSRLSDFSWISVVLPLRHFIWSLIVWRIVIGCIFSLALQSSLSQWSIFKRRPIGGRMDDWKWIGCVVCKSVCLGVEST